mmetsp:Transcript_53902/g.127279  ORF Transcript_53902/g.127279 Transcript_53902/m.127279 type:complete len:104 (+) Transcript_53902:719-1030(+)
MLRLGQTLPTCLLFQVTEVVSSSLDNLVGGASPGPCDPSPRSQIVEVVVGSVLELNQQSIGDTTVEGGPRVSGTMNGDSDVAALPHTELLHQRQAREIQDEHL